MKKIEMVDLVSQYEKIKPQVDAAVLEVMSSAMFIGGPVVKRFQENLEKYIGVSVVPCANGTDALQIAMMGLDLQPGDEVIAPAFTYAATAEVIALLKLIPRFVDVDPGSFNIDPAKIEAAIGPRTKAIVAVHLFGQCADMEKIMDIAGRHNLFVIEDVAQAIGAQYTFSDGSKKRAGAIGHVSGTSFFPSKNLGCFGDGGALFCPDQELSATLRMIANHGQSSLYYHDIVGVNSRLDALQAAVLDIKLQHLDSYEAARQKVAAYYDQAFAGLSQLKVPARVPNSTHVFHQYTLTLESADREAMLAFMTARNIPVKVYYPVPLHLQKAYNLNGYQPGDIPVSEMLCGKVISLPMHTELDEAQLEYITKSVIEFCTK